MEYIRLGRSELQVSRISLGTDQFGSRVDKAGVKRIIFAALDAGINFADTSHIYGGGLSEEFIGTALKPIRNDLIIATKGGHTHTGGPTRKKLMSELETSLRRLKTDRVDLYQVHFLIGQSTPIEVIIETLNDMQTSGKVRYIGASNQQFSVWRVT